MSPDEQRRREVEAKYALPAPSDAVGGTGMPGAAGASAPRSLGRLGLDMVWKLGLVVGVIFATTWLVRRVKGLQAGKAPAGSLQVCESARLGGDRWMHVVEVGGRRLLLGSSPQSVSLLAELDRSGGQEAPVTGEDLWVDALAPAGDRGDPDFFDRLVEAERSFDVTDLNAGGLRVSGIGDTPPRSGADSYQRALEVVASFEGRVPPVEAPRRRSRGRGYPGNRGLS